MGFNNIGGTVKLNNIKTFNNAGSKNNVFKTQFYDDVDKIDYATPYTEINYNEVNIDANEKDKGLTAQDVANLYMQSQMQQTQIEQEMYRQAGCDIINTVVAFTEGVIQFGEALVDAGALIVGVGGTILTGITDIFVNGLIFGDWDFDATSSLWKDEIVPFIGTNYTDKWYSSFYETEFMSYVEDNAHSSFKREGGVVYEISQGVGYYTGMIVVSTFTAGAVSPASTAVTKATLNATTGLMTGIGSLGKNSQKEFNKIQTTAEAENREITGGEIIKSMEIAGGKAVIDGVTYWGAGKFASPLAGKIAGTNIGGKILSTSVGQKIFGEAGIKAMLKATKGYTSEAFNSIVTGEEYDVKGASVDAAAIFASEMIAADLKKPLQNINFKTNIQSIKVTVDASTNSAHGQALTNETSDDLTEKVIQWAVKDLGKESLKEGTNKGIEKTTKEITSFAVEKLGGLAA